MKYFERRWPDEWMGTGSIPKGNHYFKYYYFLFHIGFNAKALFRSKRPEIQVQVKV